MLFFLSANSVVGLLGPASERLWVIDAGGPCVLGAAMPLPGKTQKRSSVILGIARNSMVSYSFTTEFLTNS